MSDERCNGSKRLEGCMPSLDAIQESLDNDVLEMPADMVDEELRAMGLNPDEVGKRGLAFVETLKAQRSNEAEPVQCRVVRLDDYTCELRVGAGRLAIPYAQWDEGSNFVSCIEALVNRQRTEPPKACSRCGATDDYVVCGACFRELADDERTTSEETSESRVMTGTANRDNAATVGSPSTPGGGSEEPGTFPRRESPEDWTDSNSSPLYLKLVDEVARMIESVRLGDSTATHARAIISQLAHVHGLVPRASSFEEEEEP